MTERRALAAKRQERSLTGLRAEASHTPPIRTVSPRTRVRMLASPEHPRAIVIRLDLQVGERYWRPFEQADSIDRLINDVTQATDSTLAWKVPRALYAAVHRANLPLAGGHPVVCVFLERTS